MRPATTAATLLAAATADLPDTPRLTITGGLGGGLDGGLDEALDEALELLEAQTLHRIRLLCRHEVDTITELRAADPHEEPVEPLLLIADATTRVARARIAALLTLSRRLDIHCVLLGAWPAGDTVVVNPDGTTRPLDGDDARHGHRCGDIGRLAVLTPTETADLIALLAEFHTGQPPSPGLTEPAAATHTADPRGPVPAATPALVDDESSNRPRGEDVNEEGDRGRRPIVTAHRSAGQLGQALRRTDLMADILVVDEAHHSAGRDDKHAVVLRHRTRGHRHRPGSWLSPVADRCSRSNSTTVRVAGIRRP